MSVVPQISERSCTKAEFAYLLEDKGQRCGHVLCIIWPQERLDDGDAKVRQEHDAEREDYANGDGPSGIPDLLA